MKAIYTIALAILFSFLALDAQAASYKHQLEGSFELDNRTIDVDNGGETDFDVFTLLGTYRNQMRDKLFIVGNFELQNGALDAIAFSGGAEINFISNNDTLEAGAGGWVRIFTGDISGFGIRPYGFVRSFITPNMFISGTLSYDWGIVDFMDRDADLTGISMMAGLGYAFN